ncbi:hypothetical protein ACH5RR_015212 [Cinchona calisaya]|uniref:Uncharacterized protein n=1 Tax=Cinchona calisaya TaxID=153742 RepID=A0ABD2ZXT1_9GENT
MEDGMIHILCKDDAKDLATYGLSVKLIDVFFIHKKTFLLTGSGNVSSTQRTGLDTGIEKGKNNAPHKLPQTAMTAPTIDVDMVNSGSQNRQARRKHLVRKKVKSPLKKACRGSQQRVASNDETEEDVQVEIPTIEKKVHGETECSATQNSESQVHVEITDIGSLNMQPRRKHVARKQGKSPFKKARRGNQKRGEHVGIGDDNFAIENPETKEDENGETAVVENIDSNPDYFDANNTTKIAKITENTGAKNATNVDNTESVGTKNTENASVENATNDLITLPNQDTTTEPNVGTTTQELVREPTNVISGSSRKNHGPKKKVLGKDKGKKVVDDVDIDDSTEKVRSAWANVTSHFKTQEQTVEVDNMVDSDQTYGEGEAANSDELDSNGSTCEDDGDITVQRRKHPRFKPKIDMDDPKFVLGLLFGTKEEFKKACIYHGVK